MDLGRVGEFRGNTIKTLHETQKLIILIKKKASSKNSVFYT